ncbi:DUF2798 domain-containing protein [Marinimicrobium sp. ARAG 43.8]|uniref:DUF2798 domain-containing protein n=1 Tax=Marinimicrobium sp. ARAG 43.8 TaxID=3418719 RepID=UPI003CF69CF1
MTSPTSTPLTGTRKLPVRMTPWVFSLYMATIMAFLMTLLITALNNGFSSEYPVQVWHAYRVAMPCAFGCILVVRPVVMRLVSWTVHPH